MLIGISCVRAQNSAEYAYILAFSHVFIYAYHCMYRHSAYHPPYWDIPVAQARYSIEAFVCIDLTKNGLTVLQVGPSTA